MLPIAALVALTAVLIFPSGTAVNRSIPGTAPQSAVEGPLLDAWVEFTDKGVENERERRRILGELEILVQSPDVPSNALALRADLEEDLRSRIKDVLLNMDRDPEGKGILKEFGQSRFIETTNADYKPVFDYAEAAGLDLATYDWMNE